MRPIRYTLDHYRTIRKVRICKKCKKVVSDITSEERKGFNLNRLLIEYCPICKEQTAQYALDVVLNKESDSLYIEEWLEDTLEDI